MGNSTVAGQQRHCKDTARTLSLLTSCSQMMKTVCVIRTAHVLTRDPNRHLPRPLEPAALQLLLPNTCMCCLQEPRSEGPACDLCCCCLVAAPTSQRAPSIWAVKSANLRFRLKAFRCLTLLSRSVGSLNPAPTDAGPAAAALTPTASPSPSTSESSSIESYWSLGSACCCCC